MTETAWHNAAWILPHKENPSRVLASKQNSHSHSRGGQEGALGDMHQRSEQIFCSFTTRLGLCPPRQSRQEPQLHPQVPLLDRWFLPDVPLQHKIIQDAHREAWWVSNQEILTLLHAQPANIMQNVLMSEGTADADMGEYYDDLDRTNLMFIIKMIHWKRSLYSLFPLIRKIHNEPGP